MSEDTQIGLFARGLGDHLCIYIGVMCSRLVYGVQSTENGYSVAMDETASQTLLYCTPS